MIRKSVLITGAAGRIGFATAQALAKLGYDVILCDVNKQTLDQAKDQIRSQTNIECHAVLGDASCSEGITELINESLNYFPKISSAVHCAYPHSQTWGASIHDLNQKSLFLDLQSQLGGAILFSQQIIKHFLASGGGSLIHVSSIQGIAAPKFSHYEGTTMHSPIEYSAIKAGIISITKWLARYFAGNNIRVNVVSPGGIIESQPEIFLDKYRNSCTNIGMLESSHVSDAIAFLLSDAASAINGHNLIVDDGWSL